MLKNKPKPPKMIKDNRLLKLRASIRLQKAEVRINNIKATVHYTYNGLQRQAIIKSHSEENLLKQVFWFQVEHYPAVSVKQVQYCGKSLQWDNQASTYAHYWLAEDRMSFEEFKEACFLPRKTIAV